MTNNLNNLLVTDNLENNPHKRLLVKSIKTECSVSAVLRERKGFNSYIFEKKLLNTNWNNIDLEITKYINESLKDHSNNDCKIYIRTLEGIYFS